MRNKPKPALKTKYIHNNINREITIITTDNNIGSHTGPIHGTGIKKKTSVVDKDSGQSRITFKKT